MKKCFICFLALAMLFTCMTWASADTQHYYCRANDMLDVGIPVIENPNKAVTATIRISYDHSVIELTQAGASDDTVQLPVMINGIPAGHQAIVSFHVNTNAAPDTYEITAELVSAYNAAEQPVAGLKLSPVKVTVASGPVAVTDSDPEAKQYGSGTLPNNANADQYDTTGTYYIDEGCTYTNLPITSGTLEVIRPNADASACTQIASSANNYFTRTRVGSTWGSWISAYNNIDALNSQATKDISALNSQLTSEVTNLNNSVQNVSGRVSSIEENTSLFGGDTATAQNGSMIDTNNTYTYAYKHNGTVFLHIRITCHTFSGSAQVIAILPQSMRPSGNIHYIKAYDMWSNDIAGTVSINANGNISANDNCSGKNIVIIVSYPAS